MTRISGRGAGIVAVLMAAILLLVPAISHAAEPDFFPDWQPGTTFIIIPGTDDADGADQLGRTIAVGWFGGEQTMTEGRVKLVDYPAAFGFRIGGQLIPLVGDADYNESTIVGTANAVDLVNNGSFSGPIVLNGFSQSAPIAMNAAYILHKQDPNRPIAVLIGGDPRFPNTGAEVVMPSVIEGLLTNGPRNSADTEGVEVTSFCIIGDPACGLANPLVNPVSAVFYFLPGFYLHGAMYQYSDSYEVVRDWSDGDTRYVVLDGGNPWGLVLRHFGVPVPTEVDALLNVLIPPQMPGEQTTIAGLPVPTLREIQVALYDAVGLDVPVTDPDALDRLAATTTTVHGVEPESDDTESTQLRALSDTPAVEVVDTEVSASDTPTTNTAATDAPATDQPATDGPSTDAPSTDAPATAPPTTSTADPIPGQNTWTRSKSRPGGDAGSGTTPGRNRWSRSRSDSNGSDSNGSDSNGSGSHGSGLNGSTPGGPDGNADAGSSSTGSNSDSGGSDTSSDSSGDSGQSGSSAP